MKTAKENARWLGGIALALVLAGPAWSQTEGPRPPAKPDLAASPAFQQLVQEAGPAGQDIPAEASAVPVKGSPVETGGEGLAAEVVKPPAEKLLAYARTLQRILKAYRQQWLKQEDRTMIFIVPNEDLEAYQSLRKKLNFLGQADEDGFVEILFYYIDDDRIEHIKAMKKYFYAIMRSIADRNGLDGEASKIALWARETSFTYRLRSGPANIPDHRIDILTESEYGDLIRPRK